jgi:hypothetical protein
MDCLPPQKPLKFAIFAPYFCPRGSVTQEVASSSLVSPGITSDPLSNPKVHLHYYTPPQHEIAVNSPTIWRTLLWTTFVIYFSAFMILFSKCVRAVHKLSPVSSMLIGLYSFGTFQLVFLIFNR